MARKNYESANLRFAKNALPPHSALLIECRFVQLKTLCQRSAGLAWHNISWVKVNFEGAFFSMLLIILEMKGRKRKKMLQHTDYGRQKFTPILKFLGTTGQSIFCMPHWPNFSYFFDLCLHWVSVVRAPAKWV